MQALKEEWGGMEESGMPPGCAEQMLLCSRIHIGHPGDQGRDGKQLGMTSYLHIQMRVHKSTHIPKQTNKQKPTLTFANVEVLACADGVA